ncbi:MAG TPA: hypothetical protein VI136_08820 [Verrucomicrobiae bacterium]
MNANTSGSAPSPQKRLCWREHALIAARVLAAVEKFSARCGYTPPYLELVRLAELARSGLLAQGR